MEALLTEANCVECEYEPNDPRYLCGLPTKELRARCKAAGLPVAGSRVELVLRVFSSLEGAEESKEEEGEEEEEEEGEEDEENVK